MFIRIYEENPNQKHIQQIVDVLKSGGIIIYPTDTVYGIGCDITNQKAVEKIAQIRGIKLKDAHFSFICQDLSHLSSYSIPIENNVFKMLKRNLPGPFTFILKANNNVPKLFKSNKRTVGIRVPDNNIIRTIIAELGNPILTTSVYDASEEMYISDPEIINEKYKNKVDIIIDGGFCGLEPSTVVDCSSDEITILRQGKGELL
jgi:tRNA threonylcarbamoyl adenosine modification protein (Sua5/YciO/YrdC/YwlC family)